MGNQLNPKETITPEKFIEEEKTIINSERVISVINSIKKDNMKVLDVGGASGVFLNEIIKKSKFKIIPYNLEYEDSYKDKQVNKNINFIHGSIIDNKIKDNSLDITSFRHILHHLVSNNLRDTLDNQDKAIEELIRITKPGGYLIFEEEVNNIKLFSRILYYLSRFTNKHKIKWKYFGSGNVVLSFLTPHELMYIINSKKQKYNLEILKRKYFPWHLSLRWKLTLLMSSVGSELWVVKKIL